MIKLREFAAMQGEDATEAREGIPGTDPREEFIEKLLCELKDEILDLDITTKVGRTCAAAVVQYMALARNVDSHPHVIDPLVRSCSALMEIWLFG